MSISDERLATMLAAAQRDYNQALRDDGRKDWAGASRAQYKDMLDALTELQSLRAAAKVRAIREGDGEVVAEIEGLIDAYWGLAFTEGSEGRTTDTPDGAAQDTRAAISRRLAALAASPIPATGGEKE